MRNFLDIQILHRVKARTISTFILQQFQPSQSNSAKKLPQPIFEPFLIIFGHFFPKGILQKNLALTLNPTWDSKTMLNFKKYCM